VGPEELRVFSGNNLGVRENVVQQQKTHNFCIDKSKIDIMIIQLSRCSHISSNLYFRKGSLQFVIS
jgi:hypothetical protein